MNSAIKINKSYPQQTIAPNCFVCGDKNEKGLHLKFTRTSETSVQTSLVIPDHWTGWGKLMHGGFHGVLLDEVTAWVAVGILDETFLTKAINILYHLPAYVGQEVVVTGELVSETDKKIIAKGEIRDAQGNLLSSAESIMIKVHPKMMEKIMG